MIFRREGEKAKAAVPALKSRYSLDAMTQAFYRIVEENNL